MKKGSSPLWVFANRTIFNLKVKGTRPLTRKVGAVRRMVSALWCKVAHRKDHVCWDDLCQETWGEGVILHPHEIYMYKKSWPGNKSWVCNRCKRAWYTPNSYKYPQERPIEKTQWASWTYNFPEVVEIKEKEDA